MAPHNRITLDETFPESLAAFRDVEIQIAKSEFDPLLKHLVKLRISQINGCVFCVKMHNDEARADGESQDRLDHLVVWRDVDFFSTRDKAALELAEALTMKGSGDELEQLYQEVDKHFTPQERDALTLCILMINMWNRMQIANHYIRF